MKNHAVTLGLKPCLRVECTFWLGDDGWNGSSEHPPIAVQASSFQQAKSDMEVALGKHIEHFCTRVGRRAKDKPLSVMASTVKKLELKPGMRALILGAPSGYIDSLAPMPDGVAVSESLGSAQFFATKKSEIGAGDYYRRYSCLGSA